MVAVVSLLEPTAGSEHVDYGKLAVEAQLDHLEAAVGDAQRVGEVGDERRAERIDGRRLRALHCQLDPPRARWRRR